MTERRDLESFIASAPFAATHEAGVVVTSLYLFATDSRATNMLLETNTLMALLYAFLAVLATAMYVAHVHDFPTRKTRNDESVLYRLLGSLASYTILADLIVAMYYAFDGQPFSLAALLCVVVIVLLALFLTLASGIQLGWIMLLLWSRAQ